MLRLCSVMLRQSKAHERAPNKPFRDFIYVVSWWRVQGIGKSTLRCVTNEVRECEAVRVGGASSLEREEGSGGTDAALRTCCREMLPLT